MEDSIVKKPLGRKMVDGISNFLGIGDVDEETKERYRQRREKCYRTNLKEGDEVDACVPGRKQCKAKGRESLYTMVKKAVAAKEKQRQIDIESRIRSFRPADLNKRFEDTQQFSEFRNELFYDEVIQDKPKHISEDAATKDQGEGAEEEPREESQMDMAMSRHVEEFDEYADKR